MKEQASAFVTQCRVSDGRCSNGTCLAQARRDDDERGDLACIQCSVLFRSASDGPLRRERSSVRNARTSLGRTTPTARANLIKAEMFPPEVRALGVGLSYAVANAIFGGSAEYVALWLKQASSESMFYWYVTVLCAIAGLVSFRMPDPSKEGHLRHEP